MTSIKSSQLKAGQHTACYRSRTTPCASDSQTTQPDSPQVGKQQQNSDCKQPVTAARDAHAEQRHDDARQPRRRVDTQPRASRASTHANRQAQHPRAAATRRRCPSSPTCHETAPQPLLNSCASQPLLCDYCR
jgi:hypothetical protein